MHLILSNKYCWEIIKMTIDVAQYFNYSAVGTFQDTFGWANVTNGSALIQRAAQGLPATNPINIAFTSLGSEASIKNRVYIKIPKEYISGISKLRLLSDDNVKGFGGIYFPVTPSIKQNYKANWQATNVQHTNYAVYSYNNSDVGQISVSGQFPVQTIFEGQSWLATVHALRALTKMRTGNDVLPGAPPPVCRFFAYGPDVYHNVPVVIGSFSIELPNDVDYMTSVNMDNYQIKVPVLSTISIELIPVYSRREMSNFSVTGFIEGTNKIVGYV